MDDLLKEDDRTMVLHREIAARPEALWRCWTESALIKQWFAPAPVTIVTAEVDPVPGGIFNVVMQMPGHDPMAAPPGCVLLAEPGKRLVWTAALGPAFRPNPPHGRADDFYMTIDLHFAPRDGGTRYIVRALHALPAHRKAHEEMGFYTGWGTCADQMAALAVTL